MNWFSLFFLQFTLIAFNPNNVYSISYDLKERVNDTIRVEVIKGKIIVPVTIEEETYPFILDTGGLLTISPQLAKNLALKNLDRIKVTGVNKQSVTYNQVMIPQLNFGQLSFINQLAISGSFLDEYPTKCLGALGIIGRELLNQYVVQYDLKHNFIILSNNISTFQIPEQGGIPLFYTQSGLPFINLNTSIGDIPRVIFDSGADDLLSIKKSLVLTLKRKGKIAKEDLHFFKGFFGFGVSNKTPKPHRQYILKIDSIFVGKTTILLGATDISKKSNSRIGSALLNLGKLTVDPINQKMYFQPYDKNIIALPPKTTFGFGVSSISGLNRIANLHQTLLQQKGGLKLGDVIVSVNGKKLPILSKDCSAYINGLDWNTYDEIVIETLNQKNQLKKIKLGQFTY